MGKVISKLRRLLRRVGVDVVRYPASDQLWESWASKINSQASANVIFDVGANRGQTIKWFRPLFPSATIYAFEPLSSAFQDLQQLAERDKKIFPHEFALGDKKGVATLYENSVDTTNSLLPNSERIAEFAPPHMVVPTGQVEVDVRRLDEFCSEQSIHVVDVLKVDAQGYERKILEGAGDMLQPSRIRAVYLELMFTPFYEGQCWGGELIELMRNRGYRLYGLTGVSFEKNEGWRWSDAMFVGNEA